MAKVGRPRNDGIEAFLLLIFVMYEYNALRRDGVKHSSAVTYTVRRIRARFPNFRHVRKIHISEAGVKAILALHQPQNEKTVFTVSSIAENEIQKYLEFYRAMLQQAGALHYPELFKCVLREIVDGISESKICLQLGAGPRPQYPRHNGKGAA